MQVKIVIGTVAFMLTMVIFGYAALREPARMELYAEMYDARSVEFGASIYHNNCSTCHGENGRAEVCYDAEGEQIGCAGLSLNRPLLLCGEPSARLEQYSWTGTKYGYIAGTVEAGRAANGMPTWGADYGGPLEDYEVDYVTQFVLNWGTAPGFCEDIAEPEIPDWPISVTELPEGDADAGADLYNITYGCAACHGDPAEEGSNGVGPWAGAFADLGDVRIEGYTAADYLYESILYPSSYISPDCPNGTCQGPPSTMPGNFGTRMNPQDMADMMAYLLETPTFEGNQTIIYPEDKVLDEEADAEESMEEGDTAEEAPAEETPAEETPAEEESNSEEAPAEEDASSESDG